MKIIIFLAFLVLVSEQDIRERKASNYLTLSMLLLGLVVPSDLAIEPRLLGVFIWYLFYGFGVLGGGDVKVLMATSTWLGFMSSVYCFLLAQLGMLVYLSIRDKGFLKSAIKEFPVQFRVVLRGEANRQGERLEFIPFYTASYVIYWVVFYVFH